MKQNRIIALSNLLLLCCTQSMVGMIALSENQAKRQNQFTAQYKELEKDPIKNESEIRKVLQKAHAMGDPTWAAVTEQKFNAKLKDAQKKAGISRKPIETTAGPGKEVAVLKRFAPKTTQELWNDLYSLLIKNAKKNYDQWSGYDDQKREELRMALIKKESSGRPSRLVGPLLDDYAELVPHDNAITFIDGINKIFRYLSGEQKVTQEYLPVIKRDIDALKAIQHHRARLDFDALINNPITPIPSFIGEPAPKPRSTLESSTVKPPTESKRQMEKKEEAQQWQVAQKKWSQINNLLRKNKKLKNYDAWSNADKEAITQAELSLHESHPLRPFLRYYYQTYDALNEQQREQLIKDMGEIAPDMFETKPLTVQKKSNIEALLTKHFGAQNKDEIMLIIMKNR